MSAMTYFVWPGVKEPKLNCDSEGAVISIDVFPRAVISDGFEEDEPRLRKTVCDLIQLQSTWILWPGERVVLGLGLFLVQNDWIAAFVAPRAGSVIKDGLMVVPSGPIYKGDKVTRELFVCIQNIGKVTQHINSDFAGVQVYFQHVYSPRMERLNVFPE